MKKMIGAAVRLVVFLLLGCCMLWSSAATSEAAWQPELLVGLMNGQSSVTLKANSPAVLQTSKPASILEKLPAGAALTIALNAGHLSANGREVRLTAGQELELVVPDARNLASQITTVNGRSYRGAIRLQLRNGGLTIVNRVPVEEYLRGVVPEEMPSDWNKEALKAQAVAARTFALRHRQRHSKDGYDLCATTHCQQYSGIGAERTADSQAVDVTRGETLLYNGQPIEALFHTDSGGMTENSEDVWGSRIPFLRAAREVYANTQPWDKNITAADFCTLLAKHGKSLGTLKTITLSPLTDERNAPDRTVSGRVRMVRLEGTNGTLQVSGNDLRSWLGLRSTMFQMTMRNDVVFITGYGWGHGLGLSQWGAKAFADARHMSYPDILAHYYAGTVLKKLY